MSLQTPNTPTIEIIGVRADKTKSGPPCYRDRAGTKAGQRFGLPDGYTNFVLTGSASRFCYDICRVAIADNLTLTSKITLNDCAFEQIRNVMGDVIVKDIKNSNKL